MIGIEKIRVYPTSMALAMTDLCAARGRDLAEVKDVLMVDERGVSPPWEDPVTMAVNAARPMLTEDDRRSISLLIVASETSLDQEKPLSSWIHRHLGIQPHCRNFELKHACYGATAGIQLAASWLASGFAGDGKALVINTDHSLLAIDQPYEPVMGAGASAVLLSNRPRFVELDPAAGAVFAIDTTDVIRPTPALETGNGEQSMLSYFEALDGAYDRFEALHGDVDLDAYFARNVYHVPFGGMSFRAHRSALRRQGDPSSAEIWDCFQRKTLPSLRYNRRMGGTYGSSTLVALLGLFAQPSELQPGDRIGVYAYGAGSCGELHPVRVGSDAVAAHDEAGLATMLDARLRATVSEYERAERERQAQIGRRDFVPSTGGYRRWYERHYQDRGLLVLEGVEGYVRHYGWS